MCAWWPTMMSAPASMAARANAFVERYRQHVDSGLQRGDVVHHCSSVPGSANV
jgi:hypothetical protein